MSTNGVSMSGGAPMIFDGDPMAEVAALAVTSAAEQRQSARVERDAAVEAEVAEGNEQVEAMHAKADETRTAATEDMWAGVAGGACELGGGVIAMSGPLSESKAWSKVAEPAAKITEGAGKIGQAAIHDFAEHARARAADLDADAAAHEHEMTLAKTRVDDARDDAKDANDAANKALDAYRDFESARSAASAAALHRA